MASAIGDSPMTRMRAGGSLGSRKISSSPPLRHGFETVTVPTGSWSSSAAGTDPQQQRLVRLQHVKRVEPHGRGRAGAADEPFDSTVRVDDRRIARMRGGGTLGPHDRRHDERAPRSRERRGRPLELRADHASCLLVRTATAAVGCHKGYYGAGDLAGLRQRPSRAACSSTVSSAVGKISRRASGIGLPLSIERP